ncbi:DUF4296 domain-containing protein [Olleya sp. YS]|uniref:DUF4296 domain-containing protein n=1 Tax=Olleya sp. YS TaxID=3028318 RepID=UPI0024343918|nr:DUF4296 domain-containing protein [Olleya sp. YS]WGD35541.1 DUF4296 domain-containing protein [Olleya sp. YS]
MFKSFSLVYLLLALLIVSCYGIERPSKPDNLLSEDKMVDVLVEFTLMSSAKGINKRELENRGIVPDSFVYKKHNIDSLQFANSNNYYAYDVEKYTDIYTKVKDSLEKLRTFYKAEEKKISEKKQNQLKKQRKPLKLDNQTSLDSTKVN